MQVISSDKYTYGVGLAQRKENMSIEAMSGASAVGVATTINTGPIAPSFGGEFSGGIKGPTSFGVAPDLGGTHMTGFDDAAFFETFAMPSPLLNSPEGGKFIQDISPFENTKVIWQAPSGKSLEEPFTKIMSSADLKLSDRVIQEINEIPDPIYQLSDIPNTTILSEPEVKLPLIDSRIESFIQETSLEPEVEIGKAIPIQTQQEEIIADAKQAVKVEEALMAVGKTKEEAHAIALRVFEETESKRGLAPTLKKEKLDITEDKIEPSEFHFEHDTNADEARKNAATSAVENAVKEVADGEKKNLTGHDVAEHMPHPQPKVNSEIAKREDGSYYSLIKQLEVAGEISSTSEAQGAIQRLIDENHAVRTAKVLTSQKATEQEVNKVLSGKGIVIFQK